MTAPDKILELVERFERNKKVYTSPSYNETQLRQEFINPLFEELGWDVRNVSGKAEAYKDVIHEDAIKVGKTTKAPDYSFRIGGTRKFFLETKKPSVNIRGDVSPAYQIRRYSWSTKLPLAILTDFEEFAVYDCRKKPLPTDSASVGRILYIRYDEYGTRWKEIVNIFAKTSIEQGLFDQYAESVKGKKGTSEVDDEFLKEIERWRDDLAKNIALRNPKYSVREINYAVQKTIDRIIFLRICEDRGIEPYGQFQEISKKENIYKHLLTVFEKADEKYNSGLFYFKEEKGRTSFPDYVCPNLRIDDKIFKDIIKNLYYPDCPYEFSVIGADILGNVYEQFLGKVIRLTAGHRAVVEEKPEVKKAGGVYYTPKYIVDYIVENTVGKLIEGKSPKHIEKLKVLDPACGSGSFLIGAYQKLLEYHRDWYVDHTPEKCTREIYHGKGDQWYLTLEEKKRILLNNIYGVDIDEQAVEVAKLNLLLKVLEDEHREAQKRLGGRVLPDLGQNIKCGNSLIGPDFYTGQTKIFTEEETLRINTFDWEKEFPFITNRKKYKVTIDKNVNQKIAKEYENQGLIEVCEVKIENESKKIKNKILPSGVFGHTKFGECVFSDGKRFDKIKSIIGKDKIKDVINLEAHVRERRDFFVTNDHHFLDHKSELEKLIPELKILSQDQLTEILEKEKTKGFDAVIGNPPYVRQEMLGEFKDYLKDHYGTYHGTADLFVYFIEKGIYLLSETGIYGIIVSNKWMRARYGEPLRIWLRKQNIDKIIDFGDLPVFKKATTYPCILEISNKKPKKSFNAIKIQNLDFQDLSQVVKNEQYTVNKESLDDNGWSLADEKTTRIIQKMKDGGTPLKEILNGNIYRGVLTGLNDAFIIGKETREKLIQQDPKSKELIKPFLDGKDVKRYSIRDRGNYLIRIPKGWTRETVEGKNPWNWLSSEYPTISKHLSPFKERAEKRCDKGEYWWELRTCDYYPEFEKPKIIYPEVSITTAFTLDTNNYYTNKTCFIIGSEDLFLLGVLNAKTSLLFMKNSSSMMRGGYYMFSTIYVERIPIPKVTDEEKKSIRAIVTRMLDLYKRLSNVKTPQEKSVLERQIGATDDEINQLVYKLYGLTEEEIKIVEGSEDV